MSILRLQMSFLSFGLWFLRHLDDILLFVIQFFLSTSCVSHSVTSLFMVYSLTRIRNPVPHETEHGDHALHVVTIEHILTVLTKESVSPHSSLEVEHNSISFNSSLQLFKAKFGFLYWRVLLREPFPHKLLHSAHGVQFVVTQRVS